MKLAGVTLAAVLAVLADVRPAPAADNDYPTEARVDYVLGCMAANGQSRLVLRKCACSIDYIAERLPYDDYVAVETLKRMRQSSGERTALFRETEFAKTRLEEFQRIQVQADLQCF